jgi:hypothetical protein
MDQRIRGGRVRLYLRSALYLVERSSASQHASTRIRRYGLGAFSVYLCNEGDLRRHASLKKTGPCHAYAGNHAL